MTHWLGTAACLRLHPPPPSLTLRSVPGPCPGPRSAYLTFVAVQRPAAGAAGALAAAVGQRRAAALPRVLPTTPHHRDIHADAAGRREGRLAVRRRLKEDPALAAQVRRDEGLPCGGGWTPSGV
jgi:hypothetical protein